MMKKLFVFLLCGNLFTAMAAFNSTAIWQTSTVIGDDTNAGGAYDPSVSFPGTNESLAAATALTLTLSGSGTTATSSPAFSATTHGPGNFIQITGGSGCTTGTYEMLTFTLAGLIGTFDRTMGSASSICTAYMGGPSLTLGHVAGLVVTGNQVCVKADGTYSLTSNLTITATSGAASTVTIWQGYGTTCGDRTQAVVQAGANGLTGMFTMSNQATQVSSFILDCNSTTGTVRGINITSANDVVDNVLVKNCGTNGILAATNYPVTIINTRFTGSLSLCNAGIGFTGTGIMTLLGVLVDANQCHGLLTGGNVFMANSIFANNTGATTDGFRWTGTWSSALSIMNSVFYGNGEYGFNATTTSADNVVFLRNNIAYGNATKNFQFFSVGSASNINVDYNAYPTGTNTHYPIGPHDQAITGDPTVGCGGSTPNCALNTTAGAGALLQSAGFPGALQVGGTGYLAIGALQPQTTVGSGATSYIYAQ